MRDDARPADPRRARAVLHRRRRDSAVAVLTAAPARGPHPGAPDRDRGGRQGPAGAEGGERRGVLVNGEAAALNGVGDSVNKAPDSAGVDTLSPLARTYMDAAKVPLRLNPQTFGP